MKTKNIIVAGFGVLAILVLAGAGCAKEETVTPPPADGGVTIGDVPGTGEPEVALPNPETGKNPADYYGKAKEITSSEALAGELKSIFSEACGAVKFTQEFLPNNVTGHMLIYVWRDQPTEEKLESAFIKHGYSIELPGSPIFVTKGNLELAVSWEEELYKQEIGVAIVKGE